MNEKTQYQSITQGFRLPGSATKHGLGYNAEVFRVGDKVSLQELVQYLQIQSKLISTIQLNTKKKVVSDTLETIKIDFHSIDSKIRRINDKFDFSSLEENTKISLSHAQLKYPE